MYRTVRYVLGGMAVVVAALLLLTVAFYTLVPALVGDAGGGSRLMWSGGYSSVNRPENTVGSARYQYLYFDGRERNTLNLNAGQSVSFEYRADVNYGELLMRLESPGGDVVWEKKLGASARDRADVRLVESGLHVLIVRGLRTGGGYEVSWRTN